MNLNSFFLSCFLRGYEIMGVNKTKIERMALMKKLQKEYQEFIRTLDLSVIVEYFEKGVEANQFRQQNGKILGRNDNLFWGFNDRGYQYTLRRQPRKVTKNDMSSIINEMFQKGAIKG